MHYVSHKPEWAPAQLVIDAENTLAPGYICTHELENGGGPCAGTVFSPDQSIGDHGCVVYDDGEQILSKTLGPFTREEIALAHHRYYCYRDDRRTCTGVDRFDYDYADLLAEIVTLVDTGEDT